MTGKSDIRQNIYIGSVINDKKCDSVNDNGVSQLVNTNDCENVHVYNSISNTCSRYLHVKKQSTARCYVQNKNEHDCNVSTTDGNLHVVESEQNESILDPLMNRLKQIRSNFGKNLILAHVNINGLGQKREYLKDICIKQYIDVLCVSESKLSEKYVDHEFHVNGYKCHRKDRTSKSGGLLVWIRSDLAHTRLHDKEFQVTSHHIESMVFNISVKKQTWYVILAYKNPSVPNSVFLSMVTDFYDRAIGEAKEIILLGDVNIDMQMEHNCMTNEICNIYGLSNLIEEPTCYKSERGTLIDPVLVMNKRRFQNPFNVQCGYSDWHNLVGCVTKLKVPPQRPRTVHYRSYKNFDQNKFKKDVSLIPFHVSEVFDDVNDRFWLITKMYTDVLDAHAPTKKRIIRTEQIPYMHSALRQNMYIRNMYKNRYFKWRDKASFEKYRVQRNKTSNMRKEAIKSYFLSKCKIMERPKDFWNCIKPFLSQKTSVHQNIILKEADTVVADKEEVCNIFNQFFSTIADTIGTDDSINICNENFIEEVISRHCKHASVIEITKMMTEYQRRQEFNFEPVDSHVMKMYLRRLKLTKQLGMTTSLPGWYKCVMKKCV